MTTERGDAAWSSLAPFYDVLFPPGRPQLDFICAVAARMLYPGRRLLDLGCATGGYALALAERGFIVTGVDLSEEMIRLARSRAAQWAAGRGGRRLTDGKERRGPEPAFFVGDMTDLESVPGLNPATFDLVICLGNTLANALSAAELGATLGEMARVLVRGGKAIIQVVNYDRLAATGETRLPPITVKCGAARVEVTGGGAARGGPARSAANGGSDLVFRRVYLPHADGLMGFVTVLQEAATGRTVLRQESLLRPVRRDELETVAAMALHGEVEVYGDFLFSPWSESSPATVVVAARGED